MAESNIVPLSQPARPLDRRLTVTVFRDQAAKTKHEKIVPFRDLAQVIPKFGAPDKKSLPWLKLATFGDEASDKGCLRRNANMLWIDGVEGDHDAGTMQPDEAARLLRGAGIAAIVVTTASHTPEKPRFRVLCPTCRSLPVAARQKLAARLNGVLTGAISNKDSFTDSQSFYFGQVENAAPLKILLVDGRRTIDQASELDAKALGKDGKPYKPADIDEAEDDIALHELPDWVESALDSLDAVKIGSDYFDWLDIGKGLNHGSNGDDEGRALYHTFSERTGLYDAAEVDAKWDSFGKQRNKKQITLGTIWYLAVEAGWQPPPRKNKVEFDLEPEDYTIAGWRKADIPTPESRLGAIYHAQSRMMTIGPTGLGKSMFDYDEAVSIAAGIAFMHWPASGKPCRALFIDGEMSAPVMRERILESVERLRIEPPTMFILSRDRMKNERMPPLNMEEGQDWLDQFIDFVGGVDFICFDNYQALTFGNQRETDIWQSLQSWVFDLSSRGICQHWIHHTGHEEDHGYGDKIKEWPMTAVRLMERFGDDDSEIAFRLHFTKAREKKRSNWQQFEAVIVRLADDRWRWEQAPPKSAATKLKPEERAIIILHNLSVDKENVTYDEWKAACVKSKALSDRTDKEESHTKAFNRAAEKLEKDGKIVIQGAYVRQSEVEDDDL